ncbi:MAG: hypothetical protein ACFFD4_30820 [Candidatus Odinarchaeota archaeon]
MPDNNYLSFSGGSKILSGVYSIYDHQRAENKHIAGHHVTMTEIYRDLYGAELIDQLKVEHLLYHFYAIINAFDDLIDESPDETKHAVIANSIRIFNSFFEIIRSILPADRVNQMKNVFSFVPQIIEAPARENDLISTSKTENIAETLADLLMIRCQNHVLAIKLVDSLIITETFDLETAITCLKAMEILLKDLNSDEMQIDKQQGSVNVVLYLRDRLKLKNAVILDELRKTKQILEEKIVNSSNELPERFRALLASFLRETNEEFEKKAAKSNFQQEEIR